MEALLPVVANLKQETDNNRITNHCDYSKIINNNNKSGSMSDVCPSVATLRCVLVGDSGVGKSSLLRAIAGLPPVPVAADDDSNSRVLADSVTLLVDLPAGAAAADAGLDKSSTVSLKVRIRLDDTPGSEAMDLLRPRLYTDAGAFLLCCSAAEASTADRLLTRWLPELTRHRPNLPCLLLALKSDCSNRSALSSARRVADALCSGGRQLTDAKHLMTKCSSLRWQPDGQRETKLVTRLAQLAFRPVLVSPAFVTMTAHDQVDHASNKFGRRRGNGGRTPTLCACCFSTRSSTISG